MAALAAFCITHNSSVSLVADGAGHKIKDHLRVIDGYLLIVQLHQLSPAGITDLRQA